MNKELFWRVLFYISMGGLALWTVLKSVGIIQTPFWLEYGVPAGMLIVGIFSLFNNLLKNVHTVALGLAVLTSKVNHIEKDVTILKTDVSVLKTDINVLKTDVSFLKQRI